MNRELPVREDAAPEPWRRRAVPPDGRQGAVRGVVSPAAFRTAAPPLPTSPVLPERRRLAPPGCRRNARICDARLFSPSRRGQRWHLVRADTCLRLPLLRRRGTQVGPARYVIEDLTTQRFPVPGVVVSSWAPCAIAPSAFPTVSCLGSDQPFSTFALHLLRSDACLLCHRGACVPSRFRRSG